MTLTRRGFGAGLCVAAGVAGARAARAAGRRLVVWWNQGFFPEEDQALAPWPHLLNPAYADVNARQVWDKAVAQVVVNGQKPDAAADAAIKEIQNIFAQYQIPA